MIDTLIKQFTGSGDAADVLSQLQKEGLSADQATSAVAATAEGAAKAAESGDFANLLGGSGIAGAVGGLLGGGGLGGLLGGGGAATLPAGLVDSIASTVAQKTGLPADKARVAAALILPKVIAFVQAKLA